MYIYTYIYTHTQTCTHKHTYTHLHHRLARLEEHALAHHIKHVHTNIHTHTYNTTGLHDSMNTLWLTKSGRGMEAAERWAENGAFACGDRMGLLVNMKVRLCVWVFSHV